MGERTESKLTCCTCKGQGRLSLLGDPDSDWTRCGGCQRAIHMSCANPNEEGDEYLCDRCDPETDPAEGWIRLVCGDATSPRLRVVDVREGELEFLRSAGALAPDAVRVHGRPVSPWQPATIREVLIRERVKNRDWRNCKECKDGCMHCSHCDEVSCYLHCPEREDGVHQIDMTTSPEFLKSSEGKIEVLVFCEDCCLQGMAALAEPVWG